MNGIEKTAILLVTSLLIPGCVTSPTTTPVAEKPPASVVAGPPLPPLPAVKRSARSVKSAAVDPIAKIKASGDYWYGATATPPDMVVVIDDAQRIPVMDKTRMQVVARPPHAVVVWPTTFPHWLAEYSSDLTNWTAIEEGESLDPSVLHVLVDFDATHLWDRRFYRLRSLP